MGIFATLNKSLAASGKPPEMMHQVLTNLEDRFNAHANFLPRAAIHAGVGAGLGWLADDPMAGAMGGLGATAGNAIGEHVGSPLGTMAGYGIGKAMGMTAPHITEMMQNGHDVGRRFGGTFGGISGGLWGYNRARKSKSEQPINEEPNGYLTKRALGGQMAMSTPSTAAPTSAAPTLVPPGPPQTNVAGSLAPPGSASPLLGATLTNALGSAATHMKGMMPSKRTAMIAGGLGAGALGLGALGAGVARLAHSARDMHRENSTFNRDFLQGNSDRDFLQRQRELELKRQDLEMNTKAYPSLYPGAKV